MWLLYFNGYDQDVSLQGSLLELGRKLTVDVCVRWLFSMLYLELLLTVTLSLLTSSITLFWHRVKLQ